MSNLDSLPFIRLYMVGYETDNGLSFIMFATIFLTAYIVLFSSIFNRTNSKVTKNISNKDLFK